MATMRLSEFQISERKLRFFRWHPSKMVNLGWQVPQDSMPLFLGADVLSGCSIAVSNLPRMHAKFAKQGLAVKVNFPLSVRLVGVHGTTRGVWFYSVQGLFRVCFEYYTREEQLECLNQFYATWKLRFSDPPLPQEIELDLGEIPNVPRFLDDRKSGKDTSSVTASSCNEKRDSPCIAQSEVTATAAEISTCITRKTSITNKIIDSVCITPTGEEYIEEIVHLYNNDNIPECDSLVATMTRMLKEFKEQKSCKHNRMTRTLVAASKCLGEEFNKLRDEIADRATDFKKKHITSIDCLPPASVLVEELFPDCMRIFLLTWMDSEERHDHIHSLVQVILELANMSLISGVAHVLYSRLIRTDTV